VRKLRKMFKEVTWRSKVQWGKSMRDSKWNLQGSCPGFSWLRCGPLVESHGYSAHIFAMSVFMASPWFCFTRRWNNL